MIGESRLLGPNGEELILLFDHTGRLAVEEAADAPLRKIIDQAFQGRLGYIAALLFGGLRRRHPNLTLADSHAMVEEAVDGGLLLGLQESLVKALEASMPQKVEDENPQKAPGGTGTRSSAPGAKKGSRPRTSGGRHPAASR